MHDFEIRLRLQRNLERMSERDLAGWREIRRMKHGERPFELPVYVECQSELPCMVVRGLPSHRPAT
jgi:hypothetical protein